MAFLLGIRAPELDLLDTPASDAHRTADGAGKGLVAEILTGPSHHPDGGLSAHATQVTLVGPHVPEHCRVHRPTATAPAVLLIALSPRRPILIPATPGDRRWTTSGAWVYTTDPRWPALTGGHHPLPLHDHPQ